jgi:hypothetical protein
MHNTAGDPNQEHDFASRTVDLFRAVTLAHDTKSQQRASPQAVDGRIMSSNNTYM